MSRSRLDVDDVTPVTLRVRLTGRREVADELRRTLDRAHVRTVEATTLPRKGVGHLVHCIATDAVAEATELAATLHRASPRVGILVAAHRSTDPDAARVLRAGALAILPLPVSEIELVSWLCWTVRHARFPADLQHQGLDIDEARREATWNGTPIDLAPREFALLAYLARYPGSVIPRRVLEQEVWEGDLPPGSRSLDVRVSRLRAALAAAAGEAGKPRIDTDQGQGYRLVVD